jgi:hypothetical protein
MIVDGVNIKKIDQKLTLQSARRFKVAANGTIATVVKALKEKLNASDGDVADCTVCGGAWPAELETCPFCGEADKEEHGSASSSAPANENSSGAASSVMGGSPSSEPPDPSSRAMVPANGRSTALGGGSSDTRVSVAQREEDLDRAVAAINVAKDAGAKSFWVVVQTLKRIIDTNLWKTRTDDKGDPLYKSWGDFTVKELEYSRTYVDRLMRVTKEFSAATVDELGANKLILVYSVPPEHRAKVMAEAKAGASRAKMQKIAKELNEAAGNKQSIRRAKPEPAPAAKGDAVTLAMLLGKKATIPLFRAKKDAKGKDQPAKKVEEQPVGYFDLKNDVRLIFQLVRTPSGQLKIVMTAVREA